MLSGKLDQTELADVEEELNALLASEARLDQLPEVPTHDLPERERTKGNVCEN